MSPLTQTLAATISIVLALMTALWLVSLARRDASVIDPFWGTGFVVVAWVAWRWNAADDVRPLLFVGLTTVWGLRLSLFLLWRNWGHREDRRYTEMREHHSRRFWWVSLFTVFLLQGAILWFVSLPIQVAAVKKLSTPLGWLDAIGTFVWGIGLVFETVGDWQLARFRRDPSYANRVMDRGLWRYTRHPNYFGDFCIWWGLYLIATAGGAWWTIASPLLMTFLLLKVSGVSLLEATIVDRRPAYADYRARTNSFFPGPPKTKRS